MFGLKFIKVDPTSFVLQYKNGAVISDGIENDFLQFNSGTEAVITLSQSKELLVT